MQTKTDKPPIRFVARGKGYELHVKRGGKWLLPMVYGRMQESEMLAMAADFRRKGFEVTTK